MNTPFYGPITVEGDKLIMSLHLDPCRSYLDHHRVEGVPLLGNVMAIESMATAAAALTAAAGKLHIQCVQGRVACFVPTPRTISIGAERKGDRIGCRVYDVKEGDEEVYFTAEISFGAFDAPPAFVPNRSDKVVSGEEVYRLYFHGPSFRVVESAWLEGEVMFAKMNRTLPAVFCKGVPVAMPRAIELCLQTAGLYEIAISGRMRIPERIGGIVLYEQTDEYSAELTAAARPGQNGMDITLFDNAGTVHMEVSDYLTADFPVPVDALQRLKSLF